MIDVKLLETKLKKRRVAKGGEEVVFICPFCERNGMGPDRRGHLYVNSITGQFICHRCGERGSYKTLLWLLQLPYQDIAITSDIVLVQGLDDFSQLYVKEELSSAFKSFQYLNKDHEAYKYLLNRGLTSDDIKLYHFGIFTDKVKDYVIVPIIYQGHWVTWQGRAYKSTDKRRRYYNPPNSQLHNYVFNYDLASMYKRVIITEGIFDAISAGHNGIATFGKTLSKKQIYLIVNTWPQVILAYDKDAQKEQEHIARQLCNYIDVYMFDWKTIDDSIKDLNELLIHSSKDDIQKMLKQNIVKYS